MILYCNILDMIYAYRLYPSIGAPTVSWLPGSILGLWRPSRTRGSLSYRWRSALVKEAKEAKQRRMGLIPSGSLWSFEKPCAIENGPLAHWVTVDLPIKNADGYRSKVW